MNIQRTTRPDFTFIERAAGAVGQTIQNLPGAMRADEYARQLKVSIQDAKNDYRSLVKQATEKYMKEIGENDPVKATSFVVKYFQPLTGAENQDPSKAYGRWQTAENLFNDALQKEKVRKYQLRYSGAGNIPREETTPQGLQGQRTTQVTPQPAPQFKEDVSQGIMEEVTAPYKGPVAAEKPATTPALAGQKTALQGKSSQEMQDEAERMGIAEQPDVKAMISRRKNLEFGQQPPTGPRYGAMAKTLGEYGGWTPEMEKTLMQTTTEYQEMTNKRLTDAQAQNARLKGMANKIKGRKVAADERLKIIAEKDKNDKNRASIQAQMNAISARLATAQKDVLGQVDVNAINRARRELENLQGLLYIMDDNSSVLDDLLEEKGGVPEAPQRKPAGRKPLTSFER